MFHGSQEGRLPPTGHEGPKWRHTSAGRCNARVLKEKVDTDHRGFRQQQLLEVFLRLFVQICANIRGK